MWREESKGVDEAVNSLIYVALELERLHSSINQQFQLPNREKGSV